MLLAMAVYDTAENGRTWMTEATLKSLKETVNFDNHRLFISDNGSCDETFAVYDSIHREIPFQLIENETNIGTANAINVAWSYRKRHEHAVKMDNDVVIHQAGWADWMEDVFLRDVTIGICGLKRKDLAESPFAENSNYISRVVMLPHQRGQRWIIVEQVQHVMGTCQAYSFPLLSNIGYLVQPGPYGFDDSLSAVRATKAGFKSVFLHGFEIDHIDPGGDDYTQWKMDEAGRRMADFNRMKHEYMDGTKQLYYDGGQYVREARGV